MIECMRKYPIDFIQVDYSLGNREVAETVFPVARERKIAVMAAVPLGGHFGSLMNQISNRQLPSWAADIDVDELEPVLPQVCDIASGRHMRDPRFDAAGALEDDQMRVTAASQCGLRKRMEEFWDSSESH